MRLVVLAAFLVLGSVARAQDAGAEIQGVISDQIAAFEADDFSAAFEFASAAIQRIFGGPDRFGQMVREGYPMVWRPSRFRFAGLEEHGGRVLQRLLVTDQAGALHVLEYEMVPGEDSWRINGVKILRAGDAGA